MLDDIEKLKKQHRRHLAKLPFDVKIAMLIKMQKMAEEMAISSGREFKGTVWCDNREVRSTREMSSHLPADKK